MVTNRLRVRQKQLIEYLNIKLGSLGSLGPLHDTSEYVYSTNVLLYALRKVTSELDALINLFVEYLHDYIRLGGALAPQRHLEVRLQHQRVVGAT